MAKAEYVEPKTLASLDELLAAMDGEATKMDYAEDAWSYGAPPPGGLYKFKLFLDKDGIKEGLEDQKNPKSVYYQFNLLCKITEGDFDGTPVYSKVNTRVFRGKNISTMAGLLAKLVSDPTKIPNPITPKTLAALFGKCLLKEPIVKGELDWRGAYQYKDPKTSKDEWENVFRKYTDFPIDPEDKNSRQHVVQVANKYNGGKAEVRAQAFISRFFGKNEEPPKAKVIGAAGGVTGVALAMPDLVMDEPKLVTASSVVADAGSGDLDLMLES